MTRTGTLQIFSALSLIAALMAAFFISPFTAGAANTFSAQLNRGLTQYFEAVDSSSLSVSSDATFETWVKFDSLPPDTGDTSMDFMSHWDNADRGFMWRVLNNGSSYELQFVNSSDGSAAGLVSVPWSPVTNTWYHVAVTFSSGTVKFYVNGVQQGTNQTSTEATIFNNSVNFNVGSNQGAHDMLTGKLDDARVYNIARSASAIASDYAQELNGNETGLVAYWKLNNDGGADATGNGNTLSGVNGPTYSTDVPFPVIPPFTEVLKVRKSTNESLISSAAVQNDDELKLSLAANKTYIIDGVVFASSNNGTPDLNLGLFAQSGSAVVLGFENGNTEGVLGNGTLTGRIPLVANVQKAIHIHGTVKTGATSGDFQLKWAQNVSNTHPTTVLEGSYLRADPI